jgi:hypothetical protein
MQTEILIKELNSSDLILNICDYITVSYFTLDIWIRFISSEASNKPLVFRRIKRVLSIVCCHFCCCKKIYKKSKILKFIPKNYFLKLFWRFLFYQYHNIKSNI